MNTDGKVCLITGGTKGIGAKTAVALAERGAHVALVGRHDDGEAARTRSIVESFGRHCITVTANMNTADDATRSVQETVERLGALDVLVHAAGGLVPGGLFDVTPEAWQEAFDIHVHAVYYLCRAAIPIMQRKREGVIILVSSVAGIRAIKTNVAYQVVKGAIPQFTRALAYEFADDNIRVNGVAPGIIRTRFHADMTAEQKDHNLKNRVPLHREGSPIDVARMICELIENDYITGETVTIDGGLTMRIA